MKTKIKKTAREKAIAVVEEKLGIQVVTEMSGPDMFGGFVHGHAILWTCPEGSVPHYVRTTPLGSPPAGRRHKTVEAAVKHILDVRDGFPNSVVAFTGADRQIHMVFRLTWQGWQRKAEVVLLAYVRSCVNGMRPRKRRRVKVVMGGVLLEMIKDLMADTITPEVVLDWVRDNDTTGKVEALLEAAK